MRYGFIILAAGNSSRLGRPKQLLSYRGTSLIAGLAQTTISVFPKTLVVLGAYGPEIEASLRSSGVKAPVTHNANWQEGMGSSIGHGARHLLDLYPDLDYIGMLVCDQPFLSGQVLRNLKRAARGGGQAIVACTYGGTIGTPVLFGRSYFDILKALDGTAGAKKILLEHPEQVVSVPFPKGALDIDTEEDYALLLSRIKYSGRPSKNHSDL